MTLICKTPRKNSKSQGSKKDSSFCQISKLQQLQIRKSNFPNLTSIHLKLCKLETKSRPYLKNNNLNYGHTLINCFVLLLAYTTIPYKFHSLNSYIVILIQFLLNFGPFIKTCNRIIILLQLGRQNIFWQAFLFLVFYSWDTTTTTAQSLRHGKNSRAWYTFSM